MPLSSRVFITPLRWLCYLAWSVVLCAPASLYAQDLQQAIEAGHIDAVQRLLQASPELASTPNTDDGYPLHLAAQKGHSEIGSLLLQHGAAIDQTDATGATALHEAARAGQVATARLLIVSGAALDAQTQRGKTPLHLTDQPDIIRALLQAGANPHLEDRFAQTPVKFLLNYALRFKAVRPIKNRALAAYVEEGVAFPIDGEAGRYTLHTAALIGHTTLLDTLLAQGTNPALPNNNGGTLLHSVTLGGMTDMVERLLAEGADVNATNRYGLTPLFLAAMEGHANLAEQLIASGANPNHSAPDGKQAVDYAVDFGQSAIVQQFSDLGITPQASSSTVLSGPYLGQGAPSSTPQLFAEGVVSTIHFDHSVPSFSPDGTEVYWSPAYVSRGDYILQSRLENGSWQTPTILPFCKLGGTYMYGTLSSDGSKLFFTSNQLVDGDGFGTEMNVWFVERDGETWGEPQYIGFDLGHEYGLSIAADGTLYLGVWDHDQRSSDLYRSRFVGGHYTTPERLPDGLNSPHIEDEPHIAPDESYLLFSSTRPDAYERSGVYISFRQADDTWTTPQNIAERLNMDGRVRFPGISRDGQHLFFASDQNGNWDIYWVDASILSDLQPAIFGD